MNKRTVSVLTAFILLAAVAVALNGSVLSLTNDTPYTGAGQTGAIQCLYSTQGDQSHPTTWKLRPLGSSTSWSTIGPRQMGTTAPLLYTGPNYANFEVMFFPPTGDTFTPVNPVSVRVNVHKTSIVTIHYQ